MIIGDTCNRGCRSFLNIANVCGLFESIIIGIVGDELMMVENLSNQWLRISQDVRLSGISSHEGGRAQLQWWLETGKAESLEHEERKSKPTMLKKMNSWVKLLSCLHYRSNFFDFTLEGDSLTVQKSIFVLNEPIISV